MTEQDRALIKRFWDSGLSGVAISRMFPCKSYLVRNEIAQMKKDGILDGNLGRTKEKTEKRFLELVEQGYTKEEIAEVLNLKPNTIRALYTRLHIKRPIEKKYKVGKKVHEKTQFIVYDIVKGQDIKAISNKYNVSRSYVYRLRKKCESILGE